MTKSMLIASLAAALSMAGGIPVQAGGADAQVTNLLALEQKEDSACRGGSGDDKRTEKHCAIRHKYILKLESLGWCYGKEGQYHYQMDWHQCGPQSLRSGEDPFPVNSAPATAQGEYPSMSEGERSASPGRLTEAQRNCLATNGVNLASGIYAGTGDNRDAIKSCKIPEDLIAPAISMIGGLRINGELTPTPWTDAYCKPRYLGYECSYHGVTIIFD